MENVSEIYSILAVSFYIYIILTIIFLLLDNRDASTTFAWIFVFIIFPVGGLVLYFLIGRNQRKRRPQKGILLQHGGQHIMEFLRPLIDIQSHNTNLLLQPKGEFNKKKILQLLYKNSNSILTTQNNLQVIQSGEEKFALLMRDMEQAQHSIHMEYYIWRSDPLTQKIKELLIKKVKSGVKVRILYDAFGSIMTNPGYFRQMRKAGIAVYPYYDFRSPLTIHTLNYRNHRKIVIIDGNIGYTGGMNVGREYVNGGKRFESWRSAHLRLEGEAVHVLQSIFLTSWLNTTKENFFQQDYFPKFKNVDHFMPIQLTTSEPDSQWESIQQLYFTLITSAEKSVYIQSPYFIPDKGIYTALKTAALSGLDVKLMMTGVPDKRVPYWSAFTFFRELLEAGVKIYQYQQGMLHAKTISMDGEICSVGTANMDIRSFQLNYEISTLIYDIATTKDLLGSFENDLRWCREITSDVYNNINLIFRFRNSLARLFAPIM